jgi:molecular chaperone GrpE (heat shock protein)
VLGVFLDLYDRLKRGLRTFEGGIESLRSRRQSGWLARLTGAGSQVDQALASAEAMGEGYRLTLARLEAALGQWEIERIGREGDRFDPRLMTAIEVRPAPGTSDGTVLEVCRSGYMLRGNVVAPAQVRVSKN